MQYSAGLGLSVGAATAIAGRAQAEPKKGGHLRAGLAHGSTTDTLDPATPGNDFLFALHHAINGHLTEIGTDGELEPSVAESWEPSEGASVWTIKLRDGVAFHNGKAVTADDVLRSINYHRGDDSKSVVKPIVAPIVDMRADDDRTIVFELESGNADFPFLLADTQFPILPSQDGSVDWKSGVGCGAYMLKSYSPGVSAELERNPNHWRNDRGHFDTVSLLTIVDPAARMSSLLSDAVDVIGSPELKVVEQLSAAPNVDVEEASGTLHYTLPMLTDTAPFDDNNVRLALKYAVDRQEMIDKILFGHGVVGNDHPIGRSNRFHADDLPQTSYDPDKARFHLKKAGLDTLEVSLHAADAAFSGAVDAAVLYSAAAEKAGITIKPVREANDGYWSDVYLKKPWVASYWTGRPTEDWMFSLAYTCNNEWNEAKWCSEKFDALLVEARSETDTEKRAEMYYECQKIMNEQGGSVIPMFANFIWAKRDRVTHGGEVAANRALDGMRFVERWWFA